MKWATRLLHRHVWVGMATCLKCSKRTPPCKEVHPREGQCAGNLGHPWEHISVSAQRGLAESTLAGTKTEGSWWVSGE